MKQLVLVSFLLCMVPAAFATPGTGTLFGKVLDTENGAPLAGAIVLINGSSHGAATDENGIYAVNKVPAGEQEVHVSMLGYEELRNVQVTIEASDTTVQDFSLDQRTLIREQVTITATREPSLVEDVSSSVDVIDLQMLERENPQNLGEVLKGVQGVYIKDYGGIGGIKTISLRGSSSEQVLVLLDGQRLNSAQSGLVDFSAQSVEGIEKIEVVRGGNSALYGADAIGGVINLITKKGIDGAGFTARQQTMAGSFSSFASESMLQFSRPRYSAEVSYRRIKSDGDYDYEDLSGRTKVRENNDVVSNDVFTRFRFKIDPEKPVPATVDLSYKYFQSERGAPGGIDSPFYDAFYEDRNHQVNVIYNTPLLTPFNNLRVQAYSHLLNYRYFNDEYFTPIDSWYRSGIYGGEAQFRQMLTPDVTMMYGSGGRYEWLNSDEFAANPTRTSWFAYLQNESVLHPKFIPGLMSVSFVPAARVDGFSDFGTHISPKLGSVVNLAGYPRISLKGNIGLSYRSPTFNDMFWPEDDFTMGNPDLEAEEGFDWDAGVRMRSSVLGGLEIDATYFQNRMTDLIVWAAGTNGKWQPDNVSEAHLRGVEAGFTLYPVRDNLIMRFNYTWLDAVNLSNEPGQHEKTLTYRPEHTINGEFTLQVGDVDLSYSHSYISRRYVDLSNTIWLDPYQIGDATISWETDVWELQTRIGIQVKNIYDEEYQIIQYQPLPGREYRVTLGLVYKTY